MPNLIVIATVSCMLVLLVQVEGMLMSCSDDNVSKGDDASVWGLCLCVDDNV